MFLPNGYEVPKQQGNYYKFEDGDNRFRILSSAIVGWMYWTKDNKPVRSREKFVDVPEDARLDDGQFKPKHFWAFVVFNYALNRIQILEVTQATIQGAIENYVKDVDWGDPQKYDIVVTKSGKNLDTEYQVKTKPHSQLPADVETLFNNARVNLETLYDGGDPFATSTQDVDSSEMEKNSPFND